MNDNSNLRGDWNRAANNTKIGQVTGRKQQRKQQRIQRHGGGNKQRRLNRERRAFTEPRTGRQARHIAGAQAGMEFNPVIRQKKGEIRGSIKREHELGSAYNSLAAQDAQAQAIALKAYEAGEAATNARLAAAGQADQAAAQQLAAQDQQTSQMLGGPANAEGMRTVALGNSAIAAQRNTLAAPLTAAGANNVAYLGSRVNTAHLAGFKAKQRQHGETRKLKQDKSSLLRERGQSKVSNLQKLREQEQNQRTARQAFHLERQQQGFNERMGRNQNRRENEAQRNANQEQHNQNQEQKNQNREAREGGSGKKGGLTPSERRDIRQGRHAALQRTKEFLKAHGYPKGPEAKAELVEKIEEGEGIGPQEARWAVSRLLKRHRREVVIHNESHGR